MRIMVISDTHGHIDRALKVYAHLAKESPVDCIIHCGDCIEDALELEQEVKSNGTKIVACYGNCDSERIGNPVEILETEGCSILITHGHLYGVRRDLLNLGYAAESNDCEIAIFGHTHYAMYEKVGDIKFMNPGSLTRPRDGSNGTFGLLVTSEDEVFGKIYDYASLYTV